MVRLLFALCLIVGAPLSAFAQEQISETDAISDALNKGIAECAANSGDLDRLECYDQLARSLGLDRPQPEPVDTVGTGKWSVRKDVNPIDDTTKVIASITADSGTSRWGNTINLVARCQSNQTEVYAVWHDYVGDDSNDVYSDWKYVTVRIGDASAKRQKWGVSTDKKATFAPDWAGDLLKEMADEQRLILQLTPYGESPITAVFDINGARAAFSPIAETCDWELD